MSDGHERTSRTPILAGLIGPGDRKSVQPMAERLAPGDYDQLHHFFAAGVWTRRHWRQSCSFKRIGSLVAATPCWRIDDTAAPKKGTHSVGVAAQYASAHLAEFGAEPNVFFPDALLVKAYPCCGGLESCDTARMDARASPRIENSCGSVAGKRNFLVRDKEAETALEIQGRRWGDKTYSQNPADLGLIAGFGEICVRTRMRGGAGRTSNLQTRDYGLAFQPTL